MYPNEMNDTTKKVVNPRFAKDDGYKQVLLKIEAEGKCPFCLDNFKYHKEPILLERDGWMITRASWPYENSEHHFLIISVKHKTHISDMIMKDWMSVDELVNRIIQEHHIRGGALSIRFGDPEYTGATVAHLHFHFIVPQLGKVVNFPIG